MILSGWPRGIDSESLERDEHRETIEDGSTTLIIEHGTGRRILTPRRGRPERTRPAQGAAHHTSAHPLSPIKQHLW